MITGLASLLFKTLLEQCSTEFPLQKSRYLLCDNVIRDGVISSINLVRSWEEMKQ
jgi:hypothetical protein